MPKIPTTADSAALARLGDRIADKRAQLRISQRDLAQQAGISPGYISGIETGTKQPSPEKLRKIARVIDVPYGELAVIVGYADRPTDGIGEYQEDEIQGITDLLAEAFRRLDAIRRRAKPS